MNGWQRIWVVFTALCFLLVIAANDFDLSNGLYETIEILIKTMIFCLFFLAFGYAIAWIRAGFKKSK